MKEIAITIKPTLACNMHCKHCFNGESMIDETRLDIKTAIKLIEMAADEYEVIKVTFHGGEPSMMGYDFYDEFYTAQRNIKANKAVTFSNYFTTNGLLLDERYIMLLKSNNVMLNISFDGPFNDILRNSTDTVYSNILLAKFLGAKMRVFCTLTSTSIQHIVEIYEWFNSRKIDFKIVPIEPWGYAVNHPEILISSEDYVSKLMEAYKYWVRDTNCKIKFNTFEEFMKLKRSLQFKPFWFNREIALNPDGYLYPFGRPNDVNYCLGTPSTIKNLSKAFESNSYNELLKKLNNSRQKRCAICPSIGVCNGVVANMTYMYISDEKLVDERCKTANAIFQNAMMINDSARMDIEKGKCEMFNPVVLKYLTSKEEM